MFSVAVCLLRVLKFNLSKPASRPQINLSAGLFIKHTTTDD